MVDGARNPVSENLLIIMTKAARLGVVKSRLAKGIGSARATTVYRHLERRTFRNLAQDKRWTSVIAVSPDIALSEERYLEFGDGVIAQGHGSLGQRMARLLRISDYPRTLIVGCDIPRLRAAYVANAFRLLSGHDVVMGPARDGGFWCVGIKGRRGMPSLLLPGMFSGVRFSTPDAYADTLDRLAGLQVAQAATLSDIDEYEDLDVDAGMASR